MQDNGTCFNEVQQACKSLDIESQVLVIVKLLGRCLAFRQLVSDAVNDAMESEFSLLPAVVKAVGVSTSCGVMYDPSRHICDVYGLPRPGCQGDASPCTADPYVTRLLTGVMLITVVHALPVMCIAATVA